jgi:biotin synthase
MFQPSLDDLTTQGARQLALHERAAAVTSSKFGRQVFVRGVVEVSNYCRENCHYCGMRRDNNTLSRYRASLEDLLQVLVHHRPASVTEINVQSGEDPIAVREIVLPLIRILRRETPLGVIVCLGTLDAGLYHELRAAGASVYIMKFETADPDYYRAVRAPGTLDERLKHIQNLAENGWRVSSGFIAGLPGQNGPELLRCLLLANKLPLVGCSVSPFIPGGETPFKDAPAPDANWALNCIAALRLMRPDWVIPAVSAFNLAAQEGYRCALRAGANLVTMNLTPAAVRGDYVIYKRDRFIMTEERILAAIEVEGLRPSTAGLVDYLHRQHQPKGASPQLP